MKTMEEQILIQDIFAADEEQGEPPMYEYKMYQPSIYTRVRDACLGKTVSLVCPLVTATLTTLQYIRIEHSYLLNDAVSENILPLLYLNLTLQIVLFIYYYSVYLRKKIE